MWHSEISFSAHVGAREAEDAAADLSEHVTLTLAPAIPVVGAFVKA